MGVDHLGEGGLRQEVAALWSAIRAVSVATMQNGAIGRAGIRVYDGGWILIEDGGLSVTGEATVSGMLTGTGEFNWSGDMNLSGAQTVTGPVEFFANLIVRGTLNVVGASAFGADVTITSAGRLLVGDMIIDTSGGGSVTFPGGAVVRGGEDGGVTLTHGSNSVRVNGTNIRLTGDTVLTGGLTAGFLPSISASSLGGNWEPGMLYRALNGAIYRVT